MVLRRATTPSRTNIKEDILFITGDQNNVQEVMTKTTPKQKTGKKANQLSEVALQIAEKRREAKGKGEKKRYTHLNAEFQRIARRDKKVSSAINAKK